MIKVTPLLMLALAVSLLATGCVTKGKYVDLESELNRSRAANEELTSSNRILNSKLQGLKAERDTVVRDLTTVKKEVNTLEGTYGDLVKELKREVESGQIKVRQLANGIQVELTQEILFPSGGWDLDESGRSVIERVAARIRDQGSQIVVEGHTDNVGLSASLKRRFPSNWELAGARAASVVRILVDAGVEPVTLQAVSRGPFAPVADNSTSEGRRKNRRIEIMLRPEVK